MGFFLSVLFAGFLAIQDAVSVALVQKERTLNYAFLGAQDLAICPDGSLLVSDKLDYRVLKFDRRGKLVAQIGRRGSGPGEFKGPGPIAANGDKIAVADFASHRIHLFANDLTFQTSFSVPGAILDLCFDAHGSLWVAILQNGPRDNLLKLTPTGMIETSISLRHATSDYLDNAFMFDIDAQNTIVVIYQFVNKVELWKTDGSFVRSFEISGFPASAKRKRLKDNLIVPEDNMFSGLSLDNTDTFAVLAGEYTFSPRREVFEVNKAGVPVRLAVLPTESSRIIHGPGNRLFSIENDRTSVTVYRLKRQ